jgi:hypothetical protein
LLEANEELDPETIEETLDLTVPIFGDGGEPVGYQDPEEWRVYVDWAVENGVLPDPVGVRAVIPTSSYQRARRKHEADYKHSDQRLRGGGRHSG